MAQQTNDQSQINRVLRTVMLLLGATVLLDIVYLILALQINAWQMYTLTGVVFSFGVVAVIALALIRRNRINFGIWLIIDSKSLP